MSNTNIGCISGEVWRLAPAARTVRSSGSDAETPCPSVRGVRESRPGRGVGLSDPSHTSRMAGPVPGQGRVDSTSSTTTRKIRIKPPALPLRPSGLRSAAASRETDRACLAEFAELSARYSEAGAADRGARADACGAVSSPRKMGSDQRDFATDTILQLTELRR